MVSDQERRLVRNFPPAFASSAWDKDTTQMIGQRPKNLSGARMIVLRVPASFETITRMPMASDRPRTLRSARYPAVRPNRVGGASCRGAQLANAESRTLPCQHVCASEHCCRSRCC